MTAQDIYNANILIVDDDDDLRETYSDLLMFEGFENTFQAEDGQIAVETAKNRHLDLIISDLNMPGMDGIETIKAIKEIQPNVASMILTGFGSMDVAIKAFSECNVDDFLAKPVENEELIEKIRKHLSERGSTQDVESTDMVRRDFGGSRDFLGQYLVDNDYIDEEQLIKALQEHKNSGKMLGQTLIDLGFLDEDKLVKALSEQKGYPIVDDKSFSMISDEILMMVSETIARKHFLIPLIMDGNELKVAMMNPDDLLVTDTLKMVTKKNIVPMLATKSKIMNAIDNYYSKLASSSQANSALSDIFSDNDINVEEIADTVEDSDENADSAPIVNLVNSVLAKADADGTSDIHIEPEDKYMKIRFRKDGDLYSPTGYEKLPKKLLSPMVARIKILANMKIDVKLKPQDGKIRLKLRGREIDFRVGTLPTVHGEKVVLRLLKTESLYPIEGIFSGNEKYIETFKRNIQRKDGMVLVTGPTGSGKTNTLASALNYIKDVKLNIISVEDPVEIQNEGIVQVQVNPQQDLTFATALRQILRQDPDVVLVGEMRDFETAHIGCEAALTGHLVFSTLHTNDAPSTVTRFIEMGLKDYLIGTVVHLILAQRLARSICKVCKKEHTYNKEQLLGLGLTEEEIANTTFYKGEGCPNCKGTGRSGRIAIVEMMEMTDKIRACIMSGGNALEIGKVAAEEGTYFTLKEDAIRHFKSGNIDLKETLTYSI